MNRLFSLFQLSCVFLIASSAPRGQLPDDIRLQYAYCHKLKRLSAETPIVSLPSSIIDTIDNLCMDWQQLTYHFLSSAQGGTKSFIITPKAGMTVVSLDSHTIGFRFEWHAQPYVVILCQFHEPEHVLHVYYEIYELVRLTRQNVTIRRIQKLMLDERTGCEIKFHYELAQQAGLYTEFRNDMNMIFTFKREGTNGHVGDPVFIFPAHKFNISKVLANNNVVVRFVISTVIFTFPSKSEANKFCNILRAHVDESIAMQIPPAVNEILTTTRI